MSASMIADTGLIVAYLDPDDQHHGWAAEQFERCPSFLTCEAVITESCHLAQRQHDGGARVLGLLAAGVLNIAYSVRGDESNVAELMAKYADRPMDFADACLVRMSEQHPNCEVLTVDSDFLVYRRHGSKAIKVTHP